MRRGAGLVGTHFRSIRPIRLNFKSESMNAMYIYIVCYWSSKSIETAIMSSSVSTHNSRMARNRSMFRIET